MMIDGLRYPSQSADLCQVDPSIIPTSAIERIDLLLDGASATYGSDAIGGVINIILKRNFDGAMVEGGFKMGKGGNMQYLASGTWGRTWDGGQVTLSYSWFDIAPTHGNFHSKLTFDHSPWGLDDRRPLGSSYPGTIATGSPRGPTMPDPNDPNVQIPNPAYPGNRGTNCQNCYAIPLGTGFDWAAGSSGVGPLLPGSAPTLDWANFANASNAGTNGTRNVFNPYTIGDYSAAIQYTGGAVTVDQRLTRNVSFYGSGLYGMRRSKFLINDTGHQITYSVPTFNPYYPARLARFDVWVTDRPWRSAAIGLVLLAILAAPFSALRLGQPDAGNDPGGSTTRQAYDKLAEGFGPGFNGQLVLASSVPPGAQGKLADVRAAVAKTPGVATASAPRVNKAGDAATITVVPSTSPQDDRTSDLVTRLRDETLPRVAADTGVQTYVGGSTAVFEDLSAKVAERLPVFILVVVALSIMLLMAVFRSIWVPLVSAAFNLLSILAAYGVVVAVFQWGWGSQLLGVDGEVPIVSFVPLFMFAVLFGLSMDYNVFLQSRIREEYLRGASARDSVLLGLGRVAKLILAAGAIMTAVFLGFATDPDVVVKTIGVGLASAIVIDVLIVRMLLAPAVMVLLGDRAWWFPAWLDRILPKVSLEGEVLEKRQEEERELVPA